VSERMFAKGWVFRGGHGKKIWKREIKNVLADGRLRQAPIKSEKKNREGLYRGEEGMVQRSTARKGNIRQRTCLEMGILARLG